MELVPHISFAALYFLLYFTSMDVWKLLAGVVIFLLGNGYMEEGLRHAAGRRFKLFLKRQTNQPVKAVAGGALLTMFMQSSSVVNLLVLSLVGAGVVHLHQALAVMLGSNVGTTVTGWLMATLGFYFDIKVFALPLLVVSGLLTVIYDKRHKMHYPAKFFLGFAFLFLGLSFIKEGAEFVVMNTPLTDYMGYPPIFFAILGLVLTALVQSSSVTMALVLSVLYHKGLDISSAAAIILGAEIGTTLKLGVVSMKGLAVKKRVALGNITFNTVGSVCLFFFIEPVLEVVNLFPGMQNPLLQIVAFQTCINLFSVMLFMPFLKPFGRFLEKRFREESSMEYLNKISGANIPPAIDAVEKENIHLLAHVLYYMRTLFDLDKNADDLPMYSYVQKMSQGVSYDQVKTLYGEIHAYSIKMRQQEINPEEFTRMDALLTSMRNLMYAAKSFKDIEKDIALLNQSSNEVKYQYYLDVRNETARFYKAAATLLNRMPDKDIFLQLKQLFGDVQTAYQAGIITLYQDKRSAGLSAMEMATLVNVHREMMTAFKSILFAMKETYLSPEDASYFTDLPGFIH
jgi:phosphate:Na+ symporter